jgi:adenosine deaminase/aminodeoxyfutalosine deaminase
MADIFRRWSKAELHLHLEGSVEPAALREMDPSLTAEEIGAAYKYEDFPGFLKTYAWVSKRMRTPEHYAIATRRLLETLSDQNVSYAEITLSAGVVLWKGQEFGPIFEAVQREAARSRVETRWIADIVRQFPVEDAWRVAELAAERVGEGVVAIGIGGDEARGPAEKFAEVYAWARDRGLHLHAHAGETTGPESVWDALDIGAERIGHGIAAVGDPQLLEYLRSHRIPLEICLTSNVRTGSVPSLGRHPMRALYDAGVPLILNTDDPALFECTLEGEFRIAAEHFGFTEPEMRGIARNGFRFAFERSVSAWTKSMDPFG